MIRKILVPTDFSDNAANALAYAIQIAQVNSSSITLFHTYNLPALDPMIPSNVIESFATEAEKEANLKLKKLLDAHLNSTDHQDRPILFDKVVKVGLAVDEISKFVKQNQYDLVIMGTRGASGIEEVLIGSNTASVISSSPVPVMAIPDDISYTPIEHIVYAADLRRKDAHDLEDLVSFAKAFDAHITVLHVKDDYEFNIDVEDDLLGTTKQKFGYDKLSIEVNKNSDVMKGINEYINLKNPQVIAMAFHKRNFFEKLFHRSLTKQMAYHTDIPLLALHK